MRNILLATTALTLPAGVATADITFSGKVETGIYRAATKDGVTAATDGSWVYDSASKELTFEESSLLAEPTTDAQKDEEAVASARFAYEAAKGGMGGSEDDTYKLLAKAESDQVKNAANREHINGTPAIEGDFTAYSGYDIDFTISGASDNGITFSLDGDIGAGSIADQDDDREMDSMNASMDIEEVTIGMSGMTIVLGNDTIDDLYDDSQNGDVSVAMSVGGADLTIVTDVDKDQEAIDATKAKYEDGAAFTAATEGKAAVYNPTSYKVAYAMGDLSFSLVGTEHNDNGDAATDASVTYAMGPVSLTGSLDSKGSQENIGELEVSYTTGPLTLSYKQADDKDHASNTNEDKKASTNIDLTYTSGAMTLLASTDESNAWWVNAKYDMGDAELFGTIDSTEFAVAGINFTF
jgi:hypothetical protein